MMYMSGTPYRSLILFFVKNSVNYGYLIFAKGCKKYYILYVLLNKWDL